MVPTALACGGGGFTLWDFWPVLAILGVIALVALATLAAGYVVAVLAYRRRSTGLALVSLLIGFSELCAVSLVPAMVPVYGFVVLGGMIIAFTAAARSLVVTG